MPQDDWLDIRFLPPPETPLRILEDTGGYPIYSDPRRRGAVHSREQSIARLGLLAERLPADHPARIPSQERVPFLLLNLGDGEPVALWKRRGYWRGAPVSPAGALLRWDRSEHWLLSGSLSEGRILRLANALLERSSLLQSAEAENRPAPAPRRGL